MNKHLFLTGEKQVGKSTLLNGLITNLSLPISGYRTLPFDIMGERKGYILHSLQPLPPFENDLPAVLRIGIRRHIPVPLVFETLGVQILSDSLSAVPSYILMDELGKAEGGILTFENAVTRCLNSEKSVLGVLQRGNYPLFHSISARKDVTLIEVTPENREALRASLAKQFIK